MLTVRFRRTDMTQVKRQVEAITVRLSGKLLSTPLVLLFSCLFFFFLVRASSDVMQRWKSEI